MSQNDAPKKPETHLLRNRVVTISFPENVDLVQMMVKQG
jgi:hypothetical protein